MQYAARKAGLARADGRVRCLRPSSANGDADHPHGDGRFKRGEGFDAEVARRKDGE